jgi:hypothetical protein
VLARIPHDLRRRVEPHRLRVQQRRAENVGVVAFHPARGVGDQREGRGMAFGKAIAAEPLDLRDGMLGIFAAVVALDHSADKPVLEMRNPAGDLERRH